MSPIFQYLTDDGLVADGTNQQMAVDGTTPVRFYAGPAAGEYWHVERLLLYIEDGTAPKITEYGAATALTNGVRLYVTRGGPTGIEIVDLMGGFVAKSNADWKSFCYDVDLSNPGSGNGVVAGRWTLSKAGAPVVLDGSRDDKIVALVQDNLTALVDHRIFLQGQSKNHPHTE
jgi:hypothetical protein